jgi:hypothetical protein
LPELNADEHTQVKVLLTDKFPNEKAFARTRQLLSGGINYKSSSISAFDVPSEIQGFRTIFTGFHHFRPKDGRKIIADAVRKNEGIGIFEFTARSPLAMIFVLLMSPLGALLFAPFARPFRWSRILLTYAIPVLPFCTLFDGFVSCLRTYSKEELQALVDSLPDNNYHWEICEIRARKVQPLTCLIGYPQV